MKARVQDRLTEDRASGMGAAAAADRVSVTVTTASDADARAWTAYVDAHPEGTVYHCWPWRRVLAEAFAHVPHYLVARRGERVVGVLPLAQVKTLLFGHSLSSLPFCPYAGPLADDSQAAQALDQAAVALAEKLRVDHLEYRRLPAPDETARGWPSNDLYVVFRKAISPDHDANLNAIPRKQRAMVRKGIKNGLTADAGDLDTFFDLFADNVHRHGTPAHARRYFALLLEAFGEQADLLIVRDPQGNPLSGVLSLYYRGEALPMHAGDYASARDLAANDFKYWSLMRHAVERGCTVFNYGRSKLGTGPYDFKKNWGFEPTPLVYEYKLVRGQGVPQNNPLNPKYRLMIETWRRMPRWFVNAVGPHLVRGLG
ncbi:FemAB family XrtA/PEP-CTERM system-associated protein [Zeimonas arvi]|nr:FemAB family XrtA/PEP-CTERM system-associated protein [Zeimonas arvi]